MMRYLLALFPAAALAQFVEYPVTAFGTPSNPRNAEVFYAWSRTEVETTDYVTCPPDSEICLLDVVAAGVPHDAKAVELVAMVDITQPWIVSSQNGSTKSCWVEAQYGDQTVQQWTVRARSTAWGIRDMQSNWARVENGVVPMRYRMWGTNGAANEPWPNGCSFMIRISVSSYVR